MHSGDSYSDVGYRGQPNNRPTQNNPLGIPFPGLTWNETGQPNWVGHLVKKRDASQPLLVYDYAVGGHTIDGIRQQVRSYYAKDIGAKGEGTDWTAHDTLFGRHTRSLPSHCSEGHPYTVVWIGINDCS